jgi:hypothetical protein
MADPFTQTMRVNHIARRLGHLAEQFNKITPQFDEAAPPEAQRHGRPQPGT